MRGGRQVLLAGLFLGMAGGCFRFGAKTAAPVERPMAGVILADNPTPRQWWILGPFVAPLAGSGKRVAYAFTAVTADEDAAEPDGVKLVEVKVKSTRRMGHRPGEPDEHRPRYHIELIAQTDRPISHAFKGRVLSAVADTGDGVLPPDGRLVSISAFSRVPSEPQKVRVVIELPRPNGPVGGLRELVGEFTVATADEPVTAESAIRRLAKGASDPKFGLTITGVSKTTYRGEAGHRISFRVTKIPFWAFESIRVSDAQGRRLRTGSASRMGKKAAWWGGFTVLGKLPGEVRVAVRYRPNYRKHLVRLRATDIKLPPDPPIAKWIEQLKTSTPPERIAAAQSLAKLGLEGGPAAPALIANLKHEDQSVRKAAADALASTRGETEAAVPALLRLAGDQKQPAHVRAAAFKALGRYGPPAMAALPAILDTLEHEHQSIRWGARSALRGLGPGSLDAIIKHLKSTGFTQAPVIIREIQWWGYDGIDPLIARLDHDDPRVRSLATRVLGEMTGISRRAAPNVQKMLTDKDRDVRLAAVKACGQLASYNRAALADLLRMLPDADAETRAVVIEAIGHFRNAPEVIPPLIESVDDVDVNVRRAAAQGLRQRGKLAPDKVVPVLIARLKEEKDEKAAEHLIRALGRLPEWAGKSVPMLLEQAGGWRRENGTAGQPAHAALKALGDLGPAAASAVKPLIRMCGGKNGYLADGAASALIRIGEPALPALYRAAETGDDAVGYRAGYCLALLKQPPEKLVPILIKLTANPVWSARYVAADHLGKLGESAAPAVPSLIQLLDDRTEVVRREAISSLGKIGPPARDALEKLRQIAEHDKDAAVRRLAQSAIRKIAH